VYEHGITAPVLLSRRRDVNYGERTAGLWFYLLS
jgi:hypothetical protein